MKDYHPPPFLFSSSFHFVVDVADKRGHWLTAFSSTAMAHGLVDSHFAHVLLLEATFPMLPDLKVDSH